MPAQGLEAYTSLYRIVQVAYDYRCALTGGQFLPVGGLLNPGIEVVAVQPREHGGPLTPANYLPMIHSLVPVFRDGLIVIDEDYRIIVPHPDLLDRQTLHALRSRLVLPGEPFRLDRQYLAYHRRYALGR